MAYCIEKGLILEDIPLEKYKSFSEAIDADVYEEISLENCVKKRISLGGTSPESVDRQIQQVKAKLKELNV